MALVSVILGCWLLAAPAAVGANAVAGAEVITRPGGLTPLDSGGSGTLYGVELPSGASCPGDTAHQGYHVYSYLVPKGVSPTAVSFKTGLPSQWFGYIAYGAYYGTVNTAQGTGQIVGIPPQFTWSRLTAKELFPKGEKTATWEGGVACADTHGVVTDYWNSQIAFTASPSDPKGFTWKVVAQPVLAPSHMWLWIGVALIALAVVFGAIALALSLRRRNPPPPRWTCPPSGGTSPASDPSAGHDAPEPSVAGR